MQDRPLRDLSARSSLAPLICSPGLQWQEGLDPMLLATVCDAAKDVASMLAAQLDEKKKTGKKRRENGV